MYKDIATFLEALHKERKKPNYQLLRQLKQVLTDNKVAQAELKNILKDKLLLDKLNAVLGGAVQKIKLSDLRDREDPGPVFKIVLKEGHEAQSIVRKNEIFEKMNGVFYSEKTGAIPASILVPLMYFKQFKDKVEQLYPNSIQKNLQSDQYQKSGSKIGEAPKEKTNQNIHDEISALKNELLNYKTPKSRGSVGSSQKLTNYNNQKSAEIDFFNCDPMEVEKAFDLMERSGQSATGNRGFNNKENSIESSNVSSSFFTSKIPSTISELDGFTSEVKEYLKTFKPGLKIAETLDSLNLTEREKELFGSFIDPIKCDWVEEKIVTVNEKYYDFDSLKLLQEQVNEQTGERTKVDPLTRRAFNLSSVQPGRSAYEKFQLVLLQLAYNRGHENVEALLNNSETVRERKYLNNL